jgi:hypothetical protein
MSQVARHMFLNARYATIDGKCVEFGLYIIILYRNQGGRYADSKIGLD